MSLKLTGRTNLVFQKFLIIDSWPTQILYISENFVQPVVSKLVTSY